MNYQLFRLSLMKNGLPPILDYIDGGRSVAPTRAEFLLETFSQRWDFLHWGKQFSFVSVMTLDTVIVGRIGRLAKERVSDTPENKFAPN